MLESVLAQRDHVVLGHHVGAQGSRRVAELADRRLERCFVDVAEDDGRALCHEAPRDAEPDSRRAPGDDCDFSFDA